MEAVRDAEVRPSALAGIDVVRVATATLLLLGFVFRARGVLVGTMPFWEDEAGWAIRLIDQPVLTHGFRPLGFMALSKLLVTALSPSEGVLRALPWLAGVAALLMSPLVANRLFFSAPARLLFVAVIAFHPGAIDLAKEFKPYSVGLALHMALLLFGLRYLNAGKARDLALLLGLLFIGTLFSQDAVFTYPVLFGLPLFEAFRARRTRHVLGIGLMASATLALLVAFYVFLWSTTVDHETANYWGRKYDVFFVKGEGQSRLRWVLGRIGDLAAMPGMRRSEWQASTVPLKVLRELTSVDKSVWQTLGLIGAIVLLLRRRREALFLLTPLVLLLAFNRAGYWPLGPFRTNLFALLYASGVAAMAIDRHGPRPSSGSDLVPAGVLVILPFLLFDPTTHARKTSGMSSSSAFPQAMQALLSLRPEGDAARPSLVALDNASCPPWRYYLKYHPKKAELVDVSQYFKMHCTRDFAGMLHVLRSGLPTRESRAFAILSRGRNMADVETNLPENIVLDGVVAVGERDQLVVRVKRR